MLTTVLLAGLSATIVLALVSTTLADLRTGAIASGLATARDLARDATSSYRAKLVADPWHFLDRVDESERARVCVERAAAPVLQPGAEWPADCGGAWTYVQPDGADAEVRLEVTPPSPAGTPGVVPGALVLTAVGRSGGIYGGWRTTLLQRPAGEWTVAAEDGLDLGWVDTSGETLTGASLYSGGNLDRGGVPVDGSTVVVEGQLGGAGDLTGSLVYTGLGRPDGLSTAGQASRYAEMGGGDAAELTDELDVRMRVHWGPSTGSVGLARRWGGAGEQAWSVYTDPAGHLVATTGAGVTATSSAVMPAGATSWVRVRYLSATSTGDAELRLYTAPGSVSAPTSWRRVATAAGSGVQKLPAAAATGVQLGVATSGGTSLSSGTARVAAFELRAGEDGTPASRIDLTDPAYALDAQQLADRVKGTWSLVGGAELYPSATSSTGTARDVLAAPLYTSGVQSGAEAVRSLLCPSTDPRNVVVGGRNRSTAVCLRRGGQVVDTAGELVDVPPDAVAYRLSVSPRDDGAALAANRVSTLSVWTSSTEAAAPTTGDLLAGSPAAVVDGTHPGDASYWTKLADVWLPAAGVVTTDTDVHLGLCGEAFTDASRSCAVMRPGEPVTVVAGTAASPADVWVSGPVSDDAGTDDDTSDDVTLSALATGYVLFPYWARPASSGDQLAALHLAALGGGISPSGVDAMTPVQAYPSPTDRSANTVEGRLTLRSVVARSLDLRNLGLFTDIRLVPGTSVSVRPAPYGPAFDQRWETLSSRAVPGQDVCGNEDCAGFF